jgi:putative transposase
MRPRREPATNNRQTYFVTSRTAGAHRLFQTERWARLFIETLYHYREQGAYRLHAFVVMPDHFHVLITPSGALERAVQYIKGGFSREAKLRFEYKFGIWQRGFSDHRIRDWDDYERHIAYIHMNPVRARLSSTFQEYPYSSAHPGFELDHVPQGLKPLSLGRRAAEAAPFQRNQGERDTG